MDDRELKVIREAEHKLAVLVTEHPLDIDKIKNTEGYAFNEGYHMVPFVDQGFILQFQEATKTIYIYEPIENYNNINIASCLKTVLEKYGKMKWFWEYVLISLHFNDDISKMEDLFYPIAPFIMALNGGDYQGSQLTINYSHPFDTETTLVVRVAQPMPVTVILELNILKKFATSNQIRDIMEEANKLVSYAQEVCGSMLLSYKERIGMGQ